MPDAWKRSILEGASEDAVKATFAPRILPPPSTGGYDGVVPRVLRTPFVDRWNAATDGPGDAEARELVDAIRAGRGHEYLPFTGQTAGLIDAVLPVAEVVRRLVDGADAALRAAAARASAPPGM